MEINEEINTSIQEYFPDAVLGKDNFQEQLGGYIDHLITTDFQKLIFILYRLDISEKKLQSLINEPSEMTAGEIIAAMIIERQIERIRSRKNTPPPNDESDEEKW